MKRYDIYGMAQDHIYYDEDDDDGKWVEYKDVAELIKERDALEHKLKSAEGALQAIYGSCIHASNHGLIVKNGDKISNG